MYHAVEEPDDDSVLTSPVRRRIVQHLAALPTEADGLGRGTSAADLAGILDLHVTTVRFHLHQLVTAGLVTTVMEHREGVGRPRKLYVATAAAAAAARPAVRPRSGSFEALAGLLAETWQSDGSGPRSPVEAGAAWAGQHARSALEQHLAAQAAPARSPGQWLGKVGLMLDLLREWGYTSRVSTDTDGVRIDVELSDCPFFGLARTHQEVVCGIHQGLLRGTLEVLGESAVDVRLRPFATPFTCHAQLSTRSPFATSNAPPLAVEEP